MGESGEQTYEFDSGALKSEEAMSTVAQTVGTEPAGI